MTIDDILEENARMRAEIKWLNDVITNNISELAAQVATNQLSIEDNSDNLGLVSSSRLPCYRCLFYCMLTNDNKLSWSIN